MSTDHISLPPPHFPGGTFSGHEKGGKLERVHGQGEENFPNLGTLYIFVLTLTHNKAIVLWTGEQRGGYSYASNANKRLQNLKL